MAKMLVDGVEYEVSLDFDLGEARLIKRYAGITLNELERHDPSDPDLIAAFIHIAFRRRSPEVSDIEIEERVNRVKLAKIDLRDDEEVPVRPPASAPSVPDGSASSSGASSSNGAATTPEPESREITGAPV
jgi:hypothetical protein